MSSENGDHFVSAITWQSKQHWACDKYVYTVSKFLAKEAIYYICNISSRWLRSSSFRSKTSPGDMEHRWWKKGFSSVKLGFDERRYWHIFQVRP